MYSNNTNTLTNLGSPLGGVAPLGEDGFANGINDKGQIVGGSAMPEGRVRAFVINSTETTKASDLGSLSPVEISYATAINEAGQAVGGSGHVSKWLSVLFVNGTVISLNGINGTRTDSVATDINDSYGSDGIGQIIGTLYVTGDNQPYVYIEGKMSALKEAICSEAYNCIPYAINNLGQIVGGINNNQEGFLYDLNTNITTRVIEGAVQDINDLGWMITGEYLFIDGIKYSVAGLLPKNSGVTKAYPLLLNNNGQMIAVAVNEAGQEAYVFLNPTEPISD